MRWTPNLAFDRECEAAFKFYERLSLVFRKRSHRSEFSPTFYAATFSSRYS